MLLRVQFVECVEDNITKAALLLRHILERQNLFGGHLCATGQRLATLGDLQFDART